MGAMESASSPEAAGPPAPTVCVERLCKTFFDDSRGEIRAVDDVQFHLSGRRDFRPAWCERGGEDDDAARAVDHPAA